MAHASPRPRKWKPLLLKLGAFLLLGTIVNVAVAWGFALRSVISESTCDVMSLSGKPAVPFETSIFFSADSDFLKDYSRYRTQCRGVGIREMRISRWSYNLAPEDTGDVLSQRASGLPIVSLEGRCCDMDQTDWALCLPREWTGWLRPVKVVPVAGAFIVHNSRTRLGNRAAPEFLPLCPVWPGFAINTIFFATILWLLWIAAGRVKRFIRIRRHRCPACGYQIAKGVGPRCSECGHPLPWHSQSSAA